MEGDDEIVDDRVENDKTETEEVSCIEPLRTSLNPIMTVNQRKMMFNSLRDSAPNRKN
jgi:hypothetical protein